ncbi:PqqD family protein [Nostoc sp. NIES-2111]
MHYVKTEGLQVTDVHDGQIVCHVDRERAHHLNPTAAVVFELCESPTSPEAIAAFMQRAYGLESAPLDSVSDCIATLLEEDLIRRLP